MIPIEVTTALESEHKKCLDNGHFFPGFLGIEPDRFSKEELLLILNIVWAQLQETKKDVQRIEINRILRQ